MTSVSETPETDVTPADLLIPVIRVCVLSRVQGCESVDELGKGGQKALEWGKHNEPVACQHAETGMSEEHVDVKLEKVGLVVKKEFPYLGASPDAFMTCASPNGPRALRKAEH